MSKRTTELKSLQHRAEVSKTEADQAKTQAKALKAALDKVTSRGGAGGVHRGLVRIRTGQQSENRRT